MVRWEDFRPIPESKFPFPFLDLSLWIGGLDFGLGLGFGLVNSPSPFFPSHPFVCKGNIPCGDFCCSGDKWIVETRKNCMAIVVSRVFWVILNTITTIRIPCDPLDRGLVVSDTEVFRLAITHIRAKFCFISVPSLLDNKYIRTRLGLREGLTNFWLHFPIFLVWF